jgi:hypothetical protein
MYLYNAFECMQSRGSQVGFVFPTLDGYFPNRRSFARSLDSGLDLMALCHDLHGFAFRHRHRESVLRVQRQARHDLDLLPRRKR